MAIPSDFFLFPSWLCLPLDSPLEETAFFVGFFTGVALTLTDALTPGLDFGDNLALDFVSCDVFTFERDDFVSDLVAVLDFERTCFTFSGVCILLSSGSTLTKRFSPFSRDRLLSS